MRSHTTNGTPVYLVIERDLRRQIEARKLAPGTKLPVEKALCRKYEVSRATLRKALRILADDGLILAVTGRGTFVTDPSDPELNEIRRRRRQVRRTGKTIAALIPSITMSHYPPIIRGIEDECLRHDFQLTLGNFDLDLAKEAHYLRTFMETGVRGVLVAPHYASSENPEYRRLQRRGIPLVLADSPIQGIDADLVATDNEKGAYEGAKLLIATGARRIAFVSGWMQAVTCRDRFAGFGRAMSEAGLAVDKRLVDEGEFTAEFGQALWRERLCSERLDGIFCANDPIATGLLQAMAASGRAPDRPVRMVSFDQPDVPFLFPCELIVVAQQRYEMGATACRLLLERLQAEQVANGNGQETLDQARTTGSRTVLLSPTVSQTAPAGVTQ